MLIQPMLCEPGELSQLNELRDPGWIIEEKYDGERIVAQVEGKKVHLWTRRDVEVHHKFPEVEEGLLGLGIKKHTVLDGELVVEGGFQSLHYRQTEDKLAIRVLSKKMPATYMIFDLLVLEGESIMKHPLRDRASFLASLIRTDSSVLKRTQWFPALEAKETFDRFVARGGEGVIAKRVASAYEPGKRSHEWIKFKRVKTLDVDIIGATKSDASIPFASLMMMRNGKFFGNVGTGFTLEDRKNILEFLKKNAVDKPVTELPKDVDPVILTRPIPAEVKVSEILSRGMPRAPVWVRFKVLF